MSPPAGIWLWYAGLNDESYTLLHGQTMSRDEAVAEARGQFGDDVDLYFIEAVKDEFTGWSVDVDQILERIEEDNYELGDQDGDGFLIGDTPEQRRDLEQMLTATLKAWAEKHEIKPRVWAFGATRNAEFLPAIEEGAAA
jgi:hypothetical protein